MSEIDTAARRDPRMPDGDEALDAAIAAPETNLDEDDRLKPEFVTAVLDAVEDGEAEAARALVAPLHPADIADLLELTPADRRAGLIEALGDLLSAEVLSELNDYVRDDVVEAIPNEQIAELAAELDTDDAVAIIEDLDEDDQQEVLEAMEPEDRAAIESALAYPEETAGRLMQRDLVAVPEHWSVGQTIDYLRDTADLTSDFWEIFVVDPAHKPVGTCQLSWVLRCPRDIAMTDVMKREQTLIPVDMDQEEVALRFQKYALISAAVVDENGRLVGMITVDDVVHIIQEEAGEDILRLSGAGDGDINQPILLTVRTRLFWLLINLPTAMLAATVVGLFDAEIARYALLASLMGIVSGMGGNAGTQTLAVVVRAIATNQLTSSNTRRVIFREFRIAAANGISLGLLIGIGAFAYWHNPALALVFGTAILTNNLVAGLAGVLVPVTLDRLNIDPATSSAVFVTTCTDCLGFLSFLGLAALVGLGGLRPRTYLAAMPLNLTKVAFGATSLDDMMGWFSTRGAEHKLTTRYLPKRHAEMVGGSLFWILKHQLVARSEILRFEQAEGGKTHIVIDTKLHLVRPVPRRAHQGWRYLEVQDAPPDLNGETEGDIMPGGLAMELGKLGLL